MPRIPKFLRPRGGLVRSLARTDYFGKRLLADKTDKGHRALVKKEMEINYNGDRVIRNWDKILPGGRWVAAVHMNAEIKEHEKVLAGLLEDRDPECRKIAIQQLMFKLPDKYHKKVAKRLNDLNPSVRLQAQVYLNDYNRLVKGRTGKQEVKESA